MTKSPRRAARPAPSSNPFRLNLEQQRKRAKELQRALRDGAPEAIRRFQIHHPRASSDKLSDAQLVIARELGLASWPSLAEHIARSDRARVQTTAPDRGAKTLHVRCGTDIREAWRQAGFVGDFLEYSDPICQGPVIEGEGWLQARAAFIASNYRPSAEVLADLRKAEDILASAADNFERVALWFEHDSYDQLLLARCLAVLRERMPKTVEIVTADRYPGSARYLGLGQLPPEALRLLWQARKPVGAVHLALGSTIWTALRASSPERLAALARAPMPALPFMAGALRRHCQELPWTRDGLGLTERLVLEILAEHPRTPSEVFVTLTHEREPLPWLGDIMLKPIVDNMAAVARAPFSVSGETEGRAWWRAQLTITDLGRRILAGELDWLSLKPPARWVGGVLIDANKPAWRWNDATSTPVLDT